MSSDEVNQLRKVKEYLAEWLRRFRKSQDLLPFVQSNLEITEWELDALEEEPEESQEIPKPDLAETYRDRLNYFQFAIPMIPDPDKSKFRISTAYTTSGSSDAYIHVSRVGDIGTPAAVDYSRQYTTRYDKIQHNQKRQDEVEALVARLGNAGTLDRFQRAKAAVIAVKSDVGERTSAGNEIRNLLHGVKGDLFGRARNWPKENMSWEEMTRRLVKGREGSAEFRQIIKQDTVHTSLLERLAEVLKDREGGSLTNLTYIWTQTLDHLYVVLSFIEL